VWTVSPDNASASPFGVPWSKRTSTGWKISGAQALCHELEHSGHLTPAYGNSRPWSLGAHAARRSASTCHSHPSSWFQLAKMRLATSLLKVLKCLRPASLRSPY
jgi:hypothetical protein